MELSQESLRSMIFIRCTILIRIIYQVDISVTMPFGYSLTNSNLGHRMSQCGSSGTVQNSRMKDITHWII